MNGVAAAVKVQYPVVKAMMILSSCSDSKSD